MYRLQTKVTIDDFITGTIGTYVPLSQFELQIEQLHDLKKKCRIQMQNKVNRNKKKIQTTVLIS